jgi:hypothetical protein
LAQVGGHLEFHNGTDAASGDHCNTAGTLNRAVLRNSMRVTTRTKCWDLQRYTSD